MICASNFKKAAMVIMEDKLSEIRQVAPVSKYWNYYFGPSKFAHEL